MAETSKPFAKWAILDMRYQLAPCSAPNVCPSFCSPSRISRMLVLVALIAVHRPGPLSSGIADGGRVQPQCIHRKRADLCCPSIGFGFPYFPAWTLSPDADILA